MEPRQDELKIAKLYEETHHFPLLNAFQLKSLRESASRLQKWSGHHPYFHNLINLSVLMGLFAADLWVLSSIPRDPTFSWSRLSLLSILHGVLMFNIVSYTLHEGAGHLQIIKAKGPFTRALAFIANNFCRLYYADPIFYHARHQRHHWDFGTERDGAFTNSILPERFWISLLPLASAMNYNDYRIHTGMPFTRSRIFSESLSFFYIFLIALPLILSKNVTGFWFYLGLIFFGTWIAFILDRLRETTEHNLMPTEKNNGTREFGLGFWGLLVGGGPWGQPCHLAHHLAPALPWYQQIIFHFDILKQLTPEQKKAFTVEPVVGFPLLLIRVLRENRTLAKQVAVYRSPKL